MKLTYQVNDKPKFGQVLVFALQQLLAILAATIAVPAIIGNGTKHKYLLYFDNEFPYIHQNLLTISLGTSYTVNQGLDVFDTMNRSQGSYVPRTVYYPTGHVEQSADDLHTATYVPGSLQSSVV